MAIPNLPMSAYINEAERLFWNGMGDAVLYEMAGAMSAAVLSLLSDRRSFLRALIAGFIGGLVTLILLFAFYLWRAPYSLLQQEREQGEVKNTEIVRLKNVIGDGAAQKDKEKKREAKTSLTSGLVFGIDLEHRYKTKDGDPERLKKVTQEWDQHIRELLKEAYGERTAEDFDLPDIDGPSASESYLDMNHWWNSQEAILRGKLTFLRKVISER